MERIIVIFLFLASLAFAQYDYSPDFKAGKPDEMKNLEFMDGEFEILLFYKDANIDTVRWVPSKKSFSIFSPIYDGTFILESSQGFPVNPPHEGFANWEFLMTYSYDRFNNNYRAAAADNILGLLDIYEGWLKNGKFIFTNINTLTFNNHGTDNTGQKSAFEIKKENDKKFEIIWYNADEIKTKNKDYDEIEWVPSVKMIYKKIN